MTSSHASLTASPDAGHPWRWVLITLILLATVVNYFDRLALPALAPVLRAEFGLSNVAYAWVANAFLIVYALSMFMWGAVFDRIGNRAGFTIAVVLWSLAEMGTGAARSVAGLCGLRAMLGLGEAGNWPGATRTIAEWFPVRQRALAMGIANTGASLGPTLAIPLILWLRGAFGWRAVFVITGAMGFVWLALWLALYPSRTGTLGAARAPDPARTMPVPWGVLLRRREAWGIIGARFLGDPIWWLYVNWMPL